MRRSGAFEDKYLRMRGNTNEKYVHKGNGEKVGDFQKGCRGRVRAGCRSGSYAERHAGDRRGRHNGERGSERSGQNNTV